MANYQKRTREAKARREAEAKTRQTRRDLAVKAIELASEELEAAYEYRNRLIDEDSATGMSVREIAELYGIHWTGVQHILHRRNDS